MKAEERELLLKRLRHRSRQRGFAEADEIFIAFAKSRLESLSAEQLQVYDTLLNIPDWDSFGWIVGQAEPPPELADIVALIRTNTLRT